MKNILLINDGSQTSNWGLQASSKAIIDILEVAGNNVSTIKHYDLHKEFAFDPYVLGKKLFSSTSRIQKRISPYNIKIPITADQYLLYEDIWVNKKGGIFSEYILSQIELNDIIIFNAEGSTYRKNFGSLAGLFILYLSARTYGKKACFINGSISINLVDNVLTEIIKKVASVNVSFSVREPYSYRALETIGVKSRLVPDSVFYYANQNQSAIKKENSFAVSKSMLPMLLDKEFEYKDPFIEMIVEISKASKLNPLLLSRDPEDKVLLTLKKYIPDSVICTGQYIRFNKVQRMIANTQLILSGRYHHLIFGANCDVPLCFLASSSHKIHGLSELITGNIDAPVYDPTHIKPRISEIKEYCLSLIGKKPAYKVLALKEEFVSYMGELIREQS